MHGLQVNLVSGMAQANDTKGGEGGGRRGGGEGQWDLIRFGYPGSC